MMFCCSNKIIVLSIYLVQATVVLIALSINTMLNVLGEGNSHLIFFLSSFFLNEAMLLAFWDLYTKVSLSKLGINWYTTSYKHSYCDNLQYFGWILPSE